MNCTNGTCVGCEPDVDDCTLAGGLRKEYKFPADYDPPGGNPGPLKCTLGKDLSVTFDPDNSNNGSFSVGIFAGNPDLPENPIAISLNNVMSRDTIRYKLNRLSGAYLGNESHMTMIIKVCPKDKDVRYYFQSWIDLTCDRV